MDFAAHASAPTNGTVVTAYVINAASDKEYPIPVMQQAENNIQQGAHPYTG